MGIFLRGVPLGGNFPPGFSEIMDLESFGYFSDLSAPQAKIFGTLNAFPLYKMRFSGQKLSENPPVTENLGGNFLKSGAAGGKFLWGWLKTLICTANMINARLNSQ